MLLLLRFSVLHVTFYVQFTSIFICYVNYIYNFFVKVAVCQPFI